MTREELQLKAMEFEFKLKRHPSNSEELQNILCDFVEALSINGVSNAERTLAIKFADALLNDFEMSEFEDETLCWKLCGVPHKYTTSEVYDLQRKELYYILDFSAEKQLKKTEETGRKITEYLNQYKGNPIYNDIALAIQFGVQLNNEEL